MARWGGAAVTGLGPVCALGTGIQALWTGLLEGRSGVRGLARFSPSPRGCRVAADVHEPPFSPPRANDPLPRGIELALVAARLAWEDAQLEVRRDRLGLVVGTGVGNLDLVQHALARLERGEMLGPTTAFRSFAHAAACEVARELDVRGPLETVSSGCNAGADALGLALDWLRLGRADVVLAGGTEAELTTGFFGAMEAARALSRHPEPQEASRPFDRNRDGNVPGEGAAFLVLENPAFAQARRARVRAHLRGFASRAAGRRAPYNPFEPVYDPEPMVAAARAALDDAGLLPEAVSAVSANGSSSLFYDRLEADALAVLFGPRGRPVTSTKGALGQTGAVSPALQAIAAVLALEQGVLPPTAGTDTLDPDCQVDLVVGAPRPLRLENVLVNAIGFGGFYYASSVWGRQDGSTP